jgi:hypothetical protein
VTRRQLSPDSFEFDKRRLYDIEVSQVGNFPPTEDNHEYLALENILPITIETAH